MSGGVARCKKCKTTFPAGDEHACTNLTSTVASVQGNVNSLAEPPKAKKYDGGKPDLSLLPKAALDACARAFMFGASKYGRHNFRQGMEWCRLTAAAMRHITAWQEGEDLDPESGEHHIGHALACLSMLSHYIEARVGIDNRPEDGHENS